MDMVNIGYNNSVTLLRIVAVISSKGSAARKTRNEASLSGKLVEATEGKKTRSMIVMDSGHLVLNILTCETLNERIDRADEKPGYIKLTPLQKRILKIDKIVV